MAFENMVSLHAQRLSIWRQAAIIGCCAFVTFLCAISYIAIVAPDTYYLGGMIWVMVVAILSFGAVGNFVFMQKALAQSPDYIPTTTVLSTGIILSMLWFTASITAVASSSVEFCYFIFPTKVQSGLCAAVGLADLFAWFAFLGSICFTLTAYGLGSRSGVWGGGVQQNVHMGAIPAHHPGQVYGQQPYYGGGGPGPGPGPQAGAYPQAYSQAATPQQPYTPQMAVQQPYSPQISLQQPYSPPVNLQQPYSPQANPQQPYSPQANPQQPYSPQANPQQPYSPQQQPYGQNQSPQHPQTQQPPQTHLYHESKPETP